MTSIETAFPVRVGPPKKRRTRKYSSKPMVVVPPDSELGPAMLALSPIRRRFVMELAKFDFVINLKTAKASD